MGGSSIDDDWEFTSPSNGVRTVVLVGRTGNGKSATGNSILGRKAFKSRASSAGVTSTCELQSTVLKDDQILNVIDTPGLFDFSAESEFIGKEIVNCISMAKDGIHAVLIVFSVRTRFSKEEEAALRSLQTLFGSKINDYMIVIFTGGDDLEENDETLENYLGRECPEPLKEILLLCENRRVLFDNKTKDEHKKAEQVQQLLSLVDRVITQNGGQPYTDELFTELKKGAMKLRDQTEEVNSLEGYSKREISELKDQMHRSYEEQLKRITEMVTFPIVKAKLKLENAQRTIPEFTQVGPMLVTHWGLSGPVVLRLSAWGARDLFNASYKRILIVDFIPELYIEEVKSILIQHKNRFVKQKVLNSYPLEFGLVKRFWKYILEHESLDGDILWASISNQSLMSLASGLKQCSFRVKGKGQFKEEFITAEGVSLSEISLSTMQSRIKSRLFFSGETIVSWAFELWRVSLDKIVQHI